ncbi:MAG: RNA-guided endonuclease IscB, partial [Candidatus Poribacteria bacterium]|nr:RNA-guided endonuclease IscB [Candidatus Poribacteria bacterium]
SKGWVGPSLMSRVFNIHTWVQRVSKHYPITRLAVEQVKFDTQLMENPEISGVEYQQGTLYEAEMWEYLLEKFGRKCYYCGKKNVPLEKEHILPKAKGGTDRVSNLTVSCRDCNIEKGNRHPNELTGHLGERTQKALRAAKKPLKDAQAVNTIRWKIVETLKATGLPVVYGTGGKTKWHRKRAGLPKTHYYDAACVASVPNTPFSISVLAIHAVGYGHRGDLGDYQTKQKAPGFKSPYKRIEHSGGFQKLDTVEMTTKSGCYVGCINTFDKTPNGKLQKLRIKNDWTGGDGRKSGTVNQLRRIQKRDGYAYQILESQRHEPVQTGNYIQAEFQFA